MSKAMTQEEFIAYAHEVTSYEAMECLFDTIAEHNGEVARFGDSWPGALVTIHKSIAQIHKIEATLARMEKREPRNFHFNVRHPA